MKIGLLAYHSACNFGATLQLLSTYKYLEKAGHEPVVINWIPSDLEAFYQRTTPPEQYANQLQVRRLLWRETERCYDSADVARVIEDEGIQAVIVGSDAVAQHHPWQERLVFPTRKLFTIVRYTSDRMFPNPYWGDFNKIMQHSVPVAVISASCQDSAFHFIRNKEKKRMAESVGRYAFLSVRDSWTSDMMNFLSDGVVNPEVTPDPVFAFNQNAGDLVPPRDKILSQFHLPDRYILLSLFAGCHVGQAWITELEALAQKKGYALVVLPFSQRPSMGKAECVVDLPLSPLDWYALIRYSGGYVGNNMHPIVVSLHNGVPFFSFDNYGRRSAWYSRAKSDVSSKIRHILDLADMQSQRLSCVVPRFVPPRPSWVLERLLSTDRAKENSFAEVCLERYNRMMENVLKIFIDH